MSLAFARHFLASQYYKVPELKHSFTGQTIIVTGSNTGLGFEAAKHYIKLGAAKVILAVRSLEKGNDAKQRLESSTGRTGIVEVWTLDMASYASIAEFAKKTETLERIDVLLANAGVATYGWTESVDGTEMTMAVNVYGTILLALLMIPIMRQSGRKHNSLPVLTVVSSEAHHFTPFTDERESGDPLTFLNDESKYNKFSRYNVSKLLEVFYVRELAKHMDVNTGGVIVNCANPGMCYSDFLRNAPTLIKWILPTIQLLIARTSEVGSKTLVWPTTQGAHGHGQYSLDCEFDERAVSRFVRSAEGAKTQKQIFDGINLQLEKFMPGLVEVALTV